MACAFPYLLRKKGTDLYYSVPCRRCANCIADTRSQWVDRCAYAYRQFGCGAFLTFTYDDSHVHVVRSPADDSIRATLSLRDLQIFFKCLRQYIHLHDLDSPLIQAKFKYLAVGEYGEHGSVFPRPHYHVLTFGLDFAAVQPFLGRFWKHGYYKSLPILDGAFNYVLKYMDKQLRGSAAVDAYDVHGISRPFRVQSVGLGSGLYKSVFGDDFRYVGRHKKLVPIPSYYKSKYYLGYHSPEPVDVEAAKARAARYHIQDVGSATARASFQKRLNLTRNRRLVAQMRNNGTSFYDESLYFGSPNSHVLADAEPDVLRSASDEYLAYLKSIYGDIIESITVTEK